MIILIRFQESLHGVGVSVVNALSKEPNLEFGEMVATMNKIIKRANPFLK